MPKAGTRWKSKSMYTPPKYLDFRGVILYNTNSLSLIKDRLFVVLVAGLEPARYLYRGILSPLRLPIPPHEQNKTLHVIMQSFLEAPPGFEPGHKGFADLGLTAWL